MTQRTALIVAIMVTSFLLVAVGGVSATLANRPAALPTETSVPTLPPTETPLPGVDPTLVAEREALYQQALAEANQQLQEAYQLQQSLAGELAAIPPTATPRPVVVVQQPAPTATPAQPQYPVTPEMAASIALQASPGAVLIGAPELVLFKGIVSYEVVLDRGKVYIDATTGAVLYNGAPVPQPPGSGGVNRPPSGSSSNPPPAQSSWQDDDGHEDEHEDEQESEQEEEHHEEQQEQETEDQGGDD